MNVTVFKAFGRGIGLSLRKSKLLVYSWLFNFGTALVIAAPFLFLMQKELGHSLFGRTVKTFDFLWIGEMFYRYQDIAAALAGWMAVPLILYFIASIFINGGIIGRLIDREGRTSLQSFLEDCGRYFWRFLRTFILSIPFYILVLGGFLKILSAVLSPIIENARTEWTPIILRNLHFLITLLLLSLIQMFFGYLKIIVVVESEPKVLRALGKAFRFVKTRFFRTWALALIVIAVFLGGTVLSFAASGILPGSGLTGMGLALLWAQLYLVFRVWTRILGFSAEFHYYFGNSN